MSEINRRKVMKSLGAGGITMVPGATASVAGNVGRQVRIVTARGGPKDEPIETRKVPVKWVQHNKSLRSLNKAVAEQFGHLDHVQSVYLGGSSQSTDGLVFQEQVIEATPDATQEEVESLPGTLSEAGVKVPSDVTIENIRVEQAGSVPTLTGCEDAGTLTKDPYPGGLYIKPVNNDGRGTAGFRVYHDDGTEYVLTSNHVVAQTGDGSCDVSSDSVKAYEHQDDLIGPVTDGHALHDWALVDAANYTNIDDSHDVTDISNEIWHNGGDTVTIGGYWTMSGLGTIMDVNGAAKKQGVSTGYTEGTLRGKNVWNADQNGCYRSDFNGVKVEAEAVEGDSGGPLWSESNAEAKIIGFTVLKGGSTLYTESCSGNEVQEYALGYSAGPIISNNSEYHIG